MTATPHKGPGTPVSLPEPSDAAQAHSRRLEVSLRAEIAAAGGALDFERFMDLALYAPGLGYYAAGSAKFGSAGDFVTSPEVSPLFAAGLARQLGDVLNACGDDAVVLELGAGSGVLAAGLLRELADLNRLPMRYLILEVSADLAQRQRETLAAAVPELLPRVRWLDALPETPLCGAIIGNEVVDALPVQRFAITTRHGAARVAAQHVVVDDGMLALRLGPASSATTAAVAEIESQVGPLPAGYVSEWCPRLAPWIVSIAECLQTGVLLLFDYGLSRAEYYRAERIDGTLICHYRHRAHSDPLRWPGLTDISAWVDFSALAVAARAAGLQLAGYTPQTQFLLGCGIDQILSERMAAANDRQRIELAREAKLLMLPGEMGERLRACAFTRDLDLPLAGFGWRDFSATLSN